MAIKSNLIKNFLKNVNDDDVVNIAGQLGLGTAVKLPDAGQGVPLGDGTQASVPDSIIPQGFGQSADAGAPQGAAQAAMPTIAAPPAAPAAPAAPVPPPAPVTISDLPEMSKSDAVDFFNQPKTSTQLLADRAKVSAADFSPKHSALGRFGSGLFKGIKQWMADGAPGGIGGLAGAALVGGGGAAASKGFYTNQRINEKRNLLGQQAGEMQMQEKARAQGFEQQQKALGEQAKYQGAILDNQNKVIKNANDAGKLAYETLSAKDYITADEALNYQRQYGIVINPYDGRKFKTDYHAGVPYSMPEKGAPIAVHNQSLPDIQGDKEKNWKIGNTPLISSTNKMLPVIATNEQNKVKHEIDAYEYESGRSDKQSEAAAKEAADIAEVEGKVAAAQAAMTETRALYDDYLKGPKEEQDPSVIQKYKEEFIKAKANRDGAVKELNGKKKGAKRIPGKSSSQKPDPINIR